MMAFILATDFDFIAYMSKIAFLWKLFSRQWRFWNMIGNKHNNDGQGVMTGMTIPKQHHWLFFSQMGNEDVSQEAEKDLLSNPSIQGCFFFWKRASSDPSSTLK